MTNESVIRARVRDVMSAVFGVDPDDIGPDASVDTIAAWDSVAHLQLMLAIEDAFSVQLEVEELASLRSLTDIERRLGSNDGGS